MVESKAKIVGVVCIIGLIIALGAIAYTLATSSKYMHYYNLGEQEQEAGNYHKAIGYYNKAIELNPEFVDAYYNRGACYATDGFVYHYDKLPGETYIAAGLANEQEAFDNAMADFNKVLELDQGYALAHFGKGDALYLYVDSYFARETEVIPQYEKALESKNWIRNKVGVEGVAAVYTNLGRTYLAMGELDKSYENYTKALDLAPIDTAMEHQSWVCLELGKIDETYQVATKFISMAKGSDEEDLALMPGMVAAYELGKYDEAVKYGKDIIKSFPDSGYVAEAHRFLAIIDRGKGKDKEARAQDDAAIKMCTGMIESKDTVVAELPGAYYERGLAYFDLGEYGKAIDNFKYLVDHPEMSNREVAHQNYWLNAYIGLACAYSQFGNNSEAKKVLEGLLSTLDSDPSLQAYKKYRGKSVETLLSDINEGKTISIPLTYRIISK